MATRAAAVALALCILPVMYALAEGDTFELSCYECATNGSAHFDAICDRGVNGSFAKVASVSCEDYYHRMVAEDRVALPKDQIKPQCFMSFASIYDNGMEREYRLVERGCALSPLSSVASCSETNSPSGGRTIECYCDNDDLCNSSVGVSIGGALLSVLLLISVFMNA